MVDNEGEVDKGRVGYIGDTNVQVPLGDRGTPVWVSCQILKVEGKTVRVAVQGTFRQPHGRGLRGKAAKKALKRSKRNARKMAHQLELREGVAGYYSEPLRVAP